MTSTRSVVPRRSISLQTASPTTTATALPLPEPCRRVERHIRPLHCGKSGRSDGRSVGEATVRRVVRVDRRVKRNAFLTACGAPLVHPSWTPTNFRR